MHIEYLDYFYKVATAGSISKVAKNTHISQSALSQQISKLEEILGCKLLDRSNKGVELTEKGMIVLKYADNIVRTYDTMIEHLQSTNENMKNIKIEACWSIATYSLPCVMYIIKDKFSKYNYELNPNESDIIEENVMNNICDLGVIYSKPKNQDLSYYKIGMDKIVLVSSSNYEIPDEIDFKDLIKHPFILLNDKTHVIGAITNKMKDIGLEIKDLEILYNSDSVESVKSSVVNEFGIAFLPYTSIKKELYNEQLKLINIKNYSVEYDMYLIYNKNANNNRALSEFIKYFKKVAKKSLC
ncbi:LysR family transcriptional regulator [Schnuerera sp. xch1]|uniref:LysR family transcriptional regulator n=1 Tax=Schnuerera sp. xch1 TaxID=2874283 RepID=UPI001CBFAA6C|nr:LysR family transcriptional regulator [Schnuerera sp. xch1]MBZ2175022.1 LysR family transcriptional regulator [Schnuerera sp. xch1]